MRLSPFVLERYFARHEFKARYLLSSSDCESLSQQELLGMADTATRKMWDELRLSYTESPGHPILRREIANLYETVWPDDVLVLTPEEGIFVGLNVLLQPGSHAIILSPCYQSLYQVAASTGADISRWNLETDGVRWKLDMKALERLTNSRTRLIIVNFPHNPTGFHTDKKTFSRILDFAREKDIVVFSDEMYRLSEYRVEDRLPSACDSSDGAVTLSGLSKSFALPGLRIGWLATKDRELLNRFQQFKDYTTICSSAPSELLAIMALRARDRILDRTHSILQANLDHADRFFARHHEVFEWIRPLASPVAFPRLKGTDSIDRFCDKVIEKKSILLAPGSLFEFGDNHFRIGLGKKNFPEALEQLDAFIHEEYE